MTNQGDFMRSIKKIVATGALAAAVILGGSVVGSVGAAADTAPTAKLMTKADLNPFGGLEPPAKFYWSVGADDTDRINSICLDAKGQPVLFPDAAGWTAGGRVKAKGYREVNETVRDYGSAAALASAWSALNAALATCPASTREETESGNKNDYYVVRQTPETVTDGAGILVQQRAVSRDRQINGTKTATYSVFLQSGTAIIEVNYYTNGGKTVPASTRSKVNALAADLADRWAK